jgi:hypothetical protein
MRACVSPTVNEKIEALASPRNIAKLPELLRKP